MICSADFASHLVPKMCIRTDIHQNRSLSTPELHCILAWPIFYLTGRSFEIRQVHAKLLTLHTFNEFPGAYKLICICIYMATDLLSAGYEMGMGWLWAGYGLAMGWLYAGYGLAMGWLWGGYGLSICWIWTGYGLAMSCVWADYGLAMGWPSAIHRLVISL